MADRIFYKNHSLEPYNVFLTVKFRFNGPSDPTEVEGEGVKSVTHISTGVHEIVLQDGYADIAAILPNLQTGLGLTETIAVVDTTSNSFTVRTHTVGTEGDIATGAGSGNHAHILVILRNQVS